MAVIGLATNTKNPLFSISDFTFWMPLFKKYMATEDGVTMFNNLYPLADDRILYAVFGTDWKYAMSLCIAHYAWLIASQEQTPSGDDLSSIFGGGVVSGVLSSASIGEFSKSYSLEYTMLTDEDAFFWNQSKFGQQLYALFKTKAVPKIFVVTNTNIPGGAYGVVRNNNSVIKQMSWATDGCEFVFEGDAMLISLDDGVNEASIRTSYQGIMNDALNFVLYGEFSISLNDQQLVARNLFNGRVVVPVASVMASASAPVNIEITVYRSSQVETSKLRLEIQR